MKTRKIILFIIPFIVLIVIIFFFFQKTAAPTVTLLEGTVMETTMTVISGKSSGKCVFVVGGIHGDEVAGWKAANKLKRSLGITNGTVCIVSPANAMGAKNNSRYVDDYRDLNRAFPGDANGDNVEMLADAILKEIEKYSPDIVIDLHEAYIIKERTDFLGSSVIFTSLDGIEELLPDLIEATAQGTICSEKYNYFGPAPKGSINYTVTQNLNIPALTVETYREYPLNQRISDHTDIVNYILDYYGMI